MAALPGTAPCTTRPPPAAPSNRPPRPRPSRRKSRHRSVGRPGPGPGGQRRRLHRRRPGRGPARLPLPRPLRDGLQSSAISHLPIIIILSASDAQMAALCDRPAMEPPAGGGLLFPPMRKASTTATPIGNATGIRASRPAHAGHRGGRRAAVGQRTDGQPADAALGRRDGTRPAPSNVGTPSPSSAQLSPGTRRNPAPASRADTPNRPLSTCRSRYSCTVCRPARLRRRRAGSLLESA